MAVEGLGTGSNGIAFLVSSGVVYEIIAASCSSPQTAELNADKRAETLGKWVNIGLLQAAGFVIAAAIIDRPHAKSILVGGILPGSLMWVQYAHAKQAGLASTEQGTEDW